MLKLLAPVMPHITEAIYQLQADREPGRFVSIHTTGWPAVDPGLIDASAEGGGPGGDRGWHSGSAL